jgi:outer membrane lipoprotein-sorting protein
MLKIDYNFGTFLVNNIHNKKNNMKYLVILLTFTSFIGFSQEVKDAKSEAILSKLSAKIKSLNSFYIEFSALINNPNGKTQS